MKNEIPFIVSSDPTNGAFNITPDGSSFEVQFPTPLSIPREATSCTLSITNGDIWWTIANISSGVNDKLYYTYDDGLGGGAVAYVTTIDEGLYDLTQLNNAIIRDFTNKSLPVSPALFTLSSSNATQKVIITRNYTLITFDFTQIDTFRTILGFNSQIIASNITAPVNNTANNVAKFNSVNYFLLHGDIVSKGLRYNGNYNQILAKVPINVAPGSQILYEPINPTKINANNLIGNNRTRFSFWLTDDKNNNVDTAGESFSLTVELKYY